MRKRWLACATVATALGATASVAAPSYLYIVNGAGKPLEVAIDGRPFPPIGHLQALAYRSEPGEHVLIAGAPEEINPAMRQGRQPLPTKGKATTVQVNLSDAVRDAQQREFWCFLVGQQADGTVKIIGTDKTTCTNLIERGVGDRPLS